MDCALVDCHFGLYALSPIAGSPFPEDLPSDGEEPESPARCPPGCGCTDCMVALSALWAECAEDCDRPRDDEWDLDDAELPPLPPCRAGDLVCLALFEAALAAAELLAEVEGRGPQSRSMLDALEVCGIAEASLCPACLLHRQGCG